VNKRGGIIYKKWDVAIGKDAKNKAVARRGL
jgi:hypothetical protein